MPFPDLSHLLDPDQVPDGIPQPGQSAAQPFRVIAGDGIDVAQSGAEVIISLSSDVREDIENVQSQQVDPEDPIQYMAFRIAYSAGAALINTGYIFHMHWDPDARKWLAKETEVNQGLIEAEAPFYIFAEIPMKQYTLLTEVPNYEVKSTVTIEGVNYDSIIGIKTDWTGVDEDKLLDASITPQSIFKMSVTSPENTFWPDDGKFRFVLGFIDADGNVQQTHIGGFTLPQAYSPNIIAWTLA
jgi:hypothetical protein